MTADDRSVEQRLEANRKWWDAAVPHHVSSAFYDQPAFASGKCTLHELELELAGDVQGKSLLHLQCHFGQDTLSWARRGARATGVDFAPTAVDQGNAMARQLGLDARFLQSDVLELGIGERFDVVFTSYGALGWLPDIRRWAQVVRKHLKPGGKLIVVEFHPLNDCFDGPEMKPRWPYVDGPHPDTSLEDGTYAAPDAGPLGHRYWWTHTVGAVVTALIEAGLTLEHLSEHSTCPYPNTAYDVQVEGGVQAPHRAIPLTYALVARG